MRRLLRYSEKRVATLFGTLRDLFDRDTATVSPMILAPEIQLIHRVIEELRRFQLESCLSPSGASWSTVRDRTRGSHARLRVRLRDGTDEVIETCRGIVISPEGREVEASP